MLFQAADLHLSPLIWQDQPALHGDSYAALDQIVEICCKGGEQTSLLICGDIFDKSKPDSESIARFVSAMDQLRQAAVDVYIIQGQHEKAAPPWAVALDVAKHVGDGEPFTIDVGDGGKCQQVSVIGYDYTSASDLQDKLKAVKKVDILLLHQMAKQAIDIEGAWDFDIDWVNKGVKIILAGDYHEYFTIGRLWYPGATHMRKIDEIGEKFIINVDTSGRRLSMKPIELKTRQVISLRISNDEQLDEAIKKLMDTEVADDQPEEIKTPLVVVRYSAEVQSVVARVEEACQKREFLLRLKPLVSGTEIVETTLPQANETLQACLEQLVDRKKDAELHAFVAGLLQAPEPRVVLEETKERLGIGE